MPSRPVCLILQLASPAVCLWTYSVCLDVMWRETWVWEQLASFCSEEKSMMNGTGLAPTLSTQKTTIIGFVLMPSPTERKFHFQVLFSISYCSYSASFCSLRCCADAGRLGFSQRACSFLSLSSFWIWIAVYLFYFQASVYSSGLCPNVQVMQTGNIRYRRQGDKQNQKKKKKVTEILSGWLLSSKMPANCLMPSGAVGKCLTVLQDTC